LVVRVEDLPVTFDHDILAEVLVEGAQYESHRATTGCTESSRTPSLTAGGLVLASVLF
jgi:hypothetical protein